jgi:2-dehydropantoate 2-reductase
MRIVILGAGALGSIIGAHLQRSGVETVLVARGERAGFLAEHGVRITGLEDFTCEVPVVSRPEEAPDADVLLVTVKTYDTEAALAGLRHAKFGSVASLQNGVLKDEQLAAAFGPGATFGAIADLSGELNVDGSVLFTRNVGLHFGELPTGVSPRVKVLVAALEQAGIRAFASERIRTLEWSKYVPWMGLVSLSVLSGQLTHRMLQDPDLAALQVTVVREAAGLAAAVGVELQDLGGPLIARTLSTLRYDEAVGSVIAAGQAFEAAGVTGHKMSALQDAERGRRLEVEETLGYAARKGAELGVAVPTLEVCYRLLSAINRQVVAEG